MTRKRFRVLFGVVACACVLGVYVAALADTLATWEVGAVTKFNATFVGSGGATQYMDSTKRICGYPIGVDTTGNGTYCHWIGSSRKLFGFIPDSTDVYKFYETTGPDTAIVGMDSVLCWSTTGGAPERFIYDTRALADTVISTAKIKLLAVTSGRIAAFVAGDSLKFGDGVITSTSLADGQVKTADLQDLTITSGKLAADAVGDSTKIATGAVTSADLADGQVKTADLQDLTITSGKLAADAVGDSTKIADGSVASSDLVDGQVKTADLQNLGVTSAKIAAFVAADSAKFGAGSIQRSALAAGIITVTEMAKDAAGRVPMDPVVSDTLVANVIKGQTGTSAGYVRIDGPGMSFYGLGTGKVMFNDGVDSLSAGRASTSYLFANSDSVVIGSRTGRARLVMFGDSVIVHGLYRATEAMGGR